MPIVGTAVIKFDQQVPLTLEGEWDIDRSIPTQFFYGQGNGTPGSGLLGGTKGTKQDVSGNFRFIVDSEGKEAAEMFYRQESFFTVDWPVGDPAANCLKAQAVLATFVSLRTAVNNPEGTFIITGSMKAGAVNFNRELNPELA